MANKNFSALVSQPTGQTADYSSIQDTTNGNAKNQVEGEIRKLVNRLYEKGRSLQETIDELGKNNQRIPGEDNLDLVWNLDRIEQIIDNICEIRFSDSKENKFGKKVQWQCGSHGSDIINLSRPKSFALSHKTGKLYVADTDNRRISCFNNNGGYIRMKNLRECTTPFPERIVFDQETELIWVCATDGADKTKFIAIQASDFKEVIKPNADPIMAPAKKTVRSFTIDRQTRKPTFYCYDSEFNCITYAGIDPNANPPYVADDIYLESEHLHRTEQDIEIERLDNEIFVLYQDCPKCRIIKFNMHGEQLNSYLPCDKVTRIDCFTIISSNTFLLGVVADIPLVQATQTSVMSQMEKKIGVQVCLVTFQEELKGQLSWTVEPANKFKTNDMCCSQLILHEGKLFCLLKGCENNFIAF